VHARTDDIVCPTLERLADINDHVGGGAGRDGHELAWSRAVLHLKAANVVLEKQRDDAEVEVRRDAVLALPHLGQVDGRVVHEAELARIGLMRAHVGERARWQP